MLCTLGRWGDNDMRLKQLLGIILLTMATTAVASAAVSQLSGVEVKTGQDHAVTVTIQTSGTFTHTEYRPTENLMLVDLAGVSTTHADPAVHAVQAPGLRSYRVMAYRAASATICSRRLVKNASFPTSRASARC